MPGIFWLNRRVHKGINIAFSIAMGMKQLGPSSFWKVFLFYFLGLLPAVNTPIRKSEGPAMAEIMFIQHAYLIFLFIWDTVYPWGMKLIPWLFFLLSQCEIYIFNINIKSMA